MTATMQTYRRALERFAHFDAHIQLSTILTLILIHEHQDDDGGFTTGDIQRRLGISNSAASRNTYYWGEGVDGTGGPELITIGWDVKDRRRRTLRLTAKGRAFIERVMEDLNGS